MEGREPVDPLLRPIGVVHADPDADVVIQVRYAPVTRGVVEIDPALSPALDGLDGFDWAWLVTFLDRGTVESDVAIRDYRVSAGFGFRVAVPALGPLPLAFDFAFPINRTDTDNRQLFSFYVGLFGGN